MNRKVAPALNLENLTCVIHCCAYPSTTADDKGDEGDEYEVKDGNANEDKRQDSRSSEKDLHGPEKSSKFFLTLPSLRQSKKDKFENKAAGCHGLVGDTEIVHSSLANQNQIQNQNHGGIEGAHHDYE